MTSPSDFRALQNVHKTAGGSLASFPRVALEAALRAAGKTMDDYRATVPADNTERTHAETVYQTIADELERRQTAADRAGLYDTAGAGVGPKCSNCGQPADWHDATTGACSDEDDAPHYHSEAAELAREQSTAAGIESMQFQPDDDHSSSRRVELLEEEAPHLLRPEPTTSEGETAHDLARGILEDEPWRHVPRVRELARLVLAADTLEEIPPYAPIPGEPDDGRRAPRHRSRIVLELDRAAAELLAGIVDFGGVDNDNLSGFERSTAEAIADTLRRALQ